MSTRTVLFDGRFEPQGQHLFAALSGDRNRIHLDARAARRLFYGRRILHGLHGVLRAIDAYLNYRATCGRDAVSLTELQARFLAPVYPGERVQVVLDDERESTATLSVRQGDTLLYEASVGLGAPVAAPSPAWNGPGPDEEERAPALADLIGEEGSIPLWYHAAETAGQFPNLARATPEPAIAALLAATRLVGMVSPGERSLLSALDIRLGQESPNTELRYSVRIADARFSIVKMAISGGGIAGMVEAFHRPAMVLQPAFNAVQRLVRPGEFAGVRALVIGGSRGMGEVAAKLLAAGGAEVTITYHRLRQDARRVRNEIRTGGGTCRAMRWDSVAPGPAVARLAAAGWRPTHVLFLATPRFERRRGAAFSHALLRTLVRVGVQGLRESAAALLDLTAPAPLRLFLPSTTILDNDARGLKVLPELAVAKAAAEAMCAALSAQDPRLETTIVRFPRLDTDQGQSLMRRPLAPVPEQLAPALRRFVHGREEAP